MTSTQAGIVAYCSFCLKPSTEVAKLVAGPGVYICDACTELSATIIRQSLDAEPRPAPWELPTDVDEVLAHLPVVAAAGKRVEETLTEWVRRARFLGASWARVGQALQMTRQSAWERFSGED